MARHSGSKRRESNIARGYYYYYRKKELWVWYWKNTKSENNTLHLWWVHSFDWNLQFRGGKQWLKYSLRCSSILIPPPSHKFVYPFSLLFFQTQGEKESTTFNLLLLIQVIFFFSYFILFFNSFPFHVSDSLLCVTPPMFSGYHVILVIFFPLVYSKIS